MATVYISIGYAGVKGAHGDQPAWKGPFRSEQIDVTVTAEEGALLGYSRQTACVYSPDLDGWIASVDVGSSATATTGMICPAGVATAIEIQEGQVISFLPVS